jgi:putative ABC transport system permease protein
MRFVDLLGLSLSALAQQKLRTVLTTLGVVFGTLILVVSLAVRRGVQDTITREHARFHELRLIDVRPGYRGEVPEDKVQVPGKMSRARHQRLREEKIRRWRQQNRSAPQARITPERVKELAGLGHVLSARPLLVQYGRASRGNKAEYASTLGVHFEDGALGARLVAGRLPGPDDRQGVLVTEYLLYQLGAVDEADVPEALDGPLTLRYRTGGRATPDVLLSLLRGGQAPATPAEEKLLAEVLRQLPKAVEGMGLPKAEREAALKLLRPPPPTAPPEEVLERELVIRGVLAPAEDKQFRRATWAYHSADVFLPAATAEELFLGLKRNREHGFDEVFVEVDHIDHAKEVLGQVQAQGLTAHSPVEWLEREQFIYLIIFTSMTVMALVGLLVAALGITNTMVMSVLERVREIGIMKAVGARDRHIQAVFLAEGAVLGLTGGLLGLLLGWLTSFPADAWLRSVSSRRLAVHLEGSLFAFPWWLTLGAPLFVCLLTTLAAVYPARRAVRVDPIAALRHE